MAKWWNFNKKSRWNDDGWYYQDKKPDYGWLKRIIAAVIIFLVVYVAHISGTFVGQTVDSGVRYILTQETDFNQLADKIVALTDNKLDLSVFKSIQTKLSRPANPLLYMSKPVEGRIVNSFGWYKDNITGGERLREGITIKTQPGDNVRCTANGKVKIITDSVQLGRTMIIDHGQGVETVYGRLGDILVTRNDSVSQGQIIARVAKNEKEGSMLYFEIRDKGVPIDPAARIKGIFQTIEGK